MNIKLTFIENLKTLRKARGYSQEKLAEKCNISDSFIRQIEANTRFPSPKTIEKICAALDVRPYQLFLEPQDMGDYTSEEVQNYVSSYLSNVKANVDLTIDTLISEYKHHLHYSKKKSENK